MPPLRERDCEKTYRHQIEEEVSETNYQEYLSTSSRNSKRPFLKTPEEFFGEEEEDRVTSRPSPSRPSSRPPSRSSKMKPTFFEELDEMFEEEQDISGEGSRAKTKYFL